MSITSFDNVTIQSEVEVTAFYFRGDPTTHNLETYPKRMVFDDREYNFAEMGMRYLVRKGQELIRLFDVSDGENRFRLRLDSDNHWTLVNMQAA